MDGGNKKCILLVEDEPFQREMIREFLEMPGQYSVVLAKGVFHALSLCECMRPRVDLVLIDMEMSTVDGVDLILAIREKRPDIAILGLTDTRQAELCDDVKLRRSSAGFIPTPFTPFKLHRSIAAALRPEPWRRKTLQERQLKTTTGIQWL